MSNLRYTAPISPSEADYSAIASVRDAGELNRIVGLVPEAGIDVEVLRLTYRWESVKGYIFPSEDALRFAELMGLLRIVGKTLHRTSFGSKFNSLNNANVYELSNEQVSLLVEYLFYSPNPITRTVDSMLFNFRFNQSRNRYEFSQRDYGPLPGRRELQFLLHSLRILMQAKDGILFVNPSLTREMAGKIRWFRESSRDPMDDDATKLEIARHAELLVLKYEQARLRAVGRDDLASRVEVVEEYDCTVGYDILSFDGQKSLIAEPDRFIEVKATSSDTFHFYFSETELSTSRRHGPNYWIYHLSKVTEGCDIAECLLRRIRNPAIAILDATKFEISADSLHVQAKSKGLGPLQPSEVG